jgi:hypothetical protein
MASDQRHLRLDRIVEPFADLLLAADLPQLAAERRVEVVQFVRRRIETMPSFTRFGVTVIGVFYRLLATAPAGRAAARFLVSRPLPILGEYPRLIRSLGYAYVWEHWPDTLPTGASR